MIFKQFYLGCLAHASYLIGSQGEAEITATDWAERLGTISYEIVTGIGARVPRTYR